MDKDTKDILEAVNFIKDRMATKDDVAEVRRDMATKADLRVELAPIRSDLKSIRDELDELTERFENVSGFRKEIDHALGRIRSIEKHLGLDEKLAA